MNCNFFYTVLIILLSVPKIYKIIFTIIGQTNIGISSYDYRKFQSLLINCDERFSMTHYEHVIHIMGNLRVYRIISL